MYDVIIIRYGEISLKGDNINEFISQLISNIETSNDQNIDEYVTDLKNITNDTLPDAEKKAIELLDFLGLANRAKHKPHQLSGGEQQMLAISRALITDPDLLILDEPTAGLQPSLIPELFDNVDQVHEDGTAILINEQNVGTLLERADHGYLLAEGKISLEGKAEELLANDEIQKSYLVGN